MFFAGSSENIFIRFSGSNAVVFIGDRVRLNGVIDIAKNCVCYVDRDTTAEGVAISATEAKNIIIGRDCMLSNDITLWNSDTHLIYDSKTNKRIGQGKSIYIGDHVWLGMFCGGLKKMFIASGSVIGTRSVLVGSKIFFSNTANAGNPCKEVRNDIFWTRTKCVQWGNAEESEFKICKDDSFKYAFEADKFLNPALIEEKLNTYKEPLEKLKFLYNTLYCNEHKNRFALFNDSNYKGSKLYCENKNAFSKLNIETPMLMQY